MRILVFFLTALVGSAAMAQEIGKIDPKKLSVRVFDFNSIILMHTPQNSGSPEPYTMIDGRLQRLSEVVEQIFSSVQLNDLEKRNALNKVTSCTFMSTGAVRPRYQVEGIEKHSGQSRDFPLPMTVISLSDGSVLACLRPNTTPLTLSDVRKAVGSILQVNYKNN